MNLHFRTTNCDNNETAKLIMCTKEEIIKQILQFICSDYIQISKRFFKLNSFMKLKGFLKQ